MIVCVLPEKTYLEEFVMSQVRVQCGEVCVDCLCAAFIKRGCGPFESTRMYFQAGKYTDLEEFVMSQVGAV